VNVPSTIDATGSTDVTAKLQAVIDKAPNGATIAFPSGGRYKLGTALRVSGRRSLTLDGNGARLDLPTSDLNSPRSSGIQVRDGSTGTTIRDFVLVGSNNAAGTSAAFDTNRQSNHGVAVLSATDTLVERVDIRRAWGDCLYVSRSSTGGWSDGVIFRDSTCSLTGRHGVGIIAGSRIRIVDNVFDDLGLFVVDIEPNVSIEGAKDVVIRGNRIGGYALDSDWESWVLAACGPDVGAVIRDVTLTGNTIESSRAGLNSRVNGLHVKICGDRGPRANFVVTDNVGLATVAGPAMTFTQVQGVTVTGNSQPLSRGELATFPGSSGVTYDG
jgi:hypothetical protein